MQLCHGLTCKFIECKDGHNTKRYKILRSEQFWSLNENIVILCGSWDSLTFHVSTKKIGLIPILPKMGFGLIPICDSVSFQFVIRSHSNL
jgi:hypothetical protein